MTADSEDWLQSGRGSRPRLRWSFTTDAPLLDVRLAGETGDVLAADESGGIYLLDRDGRVLTLTRVPHSLRAVAWSEIGSAGAGLLSGNRLGWFNRRLGMEWILELPDSAVTLAMDPYGYHVAVAMADGLNVIFDADKKQVCRFESIRPLRHLHFLSTEPQLVVAAEYGLLARYELSGEPLWTERLWSNVGDMAVSGDGETIYLAGFVHGIQVFDGTGVGRGSYVLEGTANHVATSYFRRRILASTIERHLYALDARGELIWAVMTPDDVTNLLCAPLGDWSVCGFTDGRLVRLDATEDS